MGVPVRNDRLRQWPLRRFPYYLSYSNEGNEYIVLPWYIISAVQDIGKDEHDGFRGGRQ
jgi:hypothetical protein